LLALLSQHTFLNIRVERQVVGIAEHLRNLAHGKSQGEQLLDALPVGIKLAPLDGAFWFAQRDTLALFCGQGFFGSETDEIALQFRKERKEGDNNF
jgi:hypothetical protein